MLRKSRLFIQTQVLEASCPHSYVEFMCRPHISNYSVNLQFFLFHSVMQVLHCLTLLILTICNGNVLTTVYLVCRPVLAEDCWGLAPERCRLLSARKYNCATIMPQ